MVRPGEEFPASAPKRLILLALLAAALLPLLAMFGFNYLADRYSVFHLNRGYSSTSNMNYARMEYLLREGHTHPMLLLGSSRSQALLAHERIEERAYTFPSAGGRIHHHYQNLRTLLENGIVPDRVILGLGESVIKIPPVTAADSSPTGRLHWKVQGVHPLRFYWGYLTVRPRWDHISHLWDIVELRLQGIGLTRSALLARTGRYYCFDCQASVLAKPYDEHARHIQNTIGVHPNRNSAESAVKVVADIKSLTERYGVRLFVFVDPIYRGQFLRDDFREYAKFKYLLAELTPYLDFNNLDPEFAEPRNFTDATHYGTATGGRMATEIKAVVDGQTEGLKLGTWVTSDNVEEYLKDQSTRYEQLRERVDYVSAK